MTQDKVFIEGLQVEASIGVFEWEKSIKQSLLFDIDMTTRLTTAGQSDDLADTVCYATVSEQIIQIVKRKHYDLLEALAEVITTTLVDAFPIEQIRLKIYKPGAVPQAKSVGIEIVREKIH